MKRSTIMLVSLICMIILSSCSNSKNRMPYRNNVENTIQEQVTAEDTQKETKIETPSEAEQGTQNTNTREVAKDDNMKKSSTSNPEIDYDLTQMSSDMVYATVYQLVTDPSSYIGKTIRMRGAYTAEWYEATAQYYHCVIIQDATACCAQGMEFVWGDGKHVYPDEYPSNDTIIEVTGIFETYQEEGDNNLYCRLRDASLIVIE